MVPSLMLPNVGADGAQIVALIAICAAILTVFEYGSNYPCLFEFRDAPPFNRIRFFSLLLTVVLLSLIARGQQVPSSLSTFLAVAGHVVASSIDFPFSPVRLVILMLPEGTSDSSLFMLRTSAGLAYLASLISMAIFILAIRRRDWPLRGGQFNVWINLPTFDPTANGDVVHRLRRDGRVNIALGFVLPFAMPAVVNAASSVFGSLSLEDPQTTIWAVAAWSFLPASLFMRGIAMSRVAAMISEKRQSATEMDSPFLVA